MLFYIYCVCVVFYPALFSISLAAGIIYGVIQDYGIDVCVKAGLLGAYKSLNSYSAISSDISPALMTEESIQQWASFEPVELLR